MKTIQQPLRAEPQAGARIILNTNRDTQVIERRFIVNPGGHDRRLARIQLITPGVPEGQSPVLHWRLFRLAGKPSAESASTQRELATNWTPFGGPQEVPAEAEDETGPFYVEDLGLLGPLHEGECLILHLIANNRGLIPLFTDGEIRSELHIEIEGFAPIPFPLHLEKPTWNAETAHYLALDYGNQDFMLAYMEGSEPRLITPSILEQEEEGRKALLIPESSKAVVVDTFDPVAPVFMLGNAVEMVSDEWQEKDPVWIDPYFTGSRIESLKPHLFCSADSVLQRQALFGQPPSSANAYKISEDGLSIFLKRYFQKIIGTIDWHLSGGARGTQFKIHSPIIVTHPVGVDRLLRKRISTCFEHDPPYLHHDRKVKFINEAMAALGTIWSERIQRNLDAQRQKFRRSGQPLPRFRDQVRLAMDLPIAEESAAGEDPKRSDYVLILQVDVGHGTTDLCISRVESRRVQIPGGVGEKLIFQQALPYSMHCGGRDLTKAVYQHCIRWLKDETVSPVVPAPIMKVLTAEEGVANNENAPHFWRFLQVIENYKKQFADETTSATSSRELIEICKSIANIKGLPYEPAEEDKSFEILAEDIRAAMKPVVQEIARTVASLKRAFEADQKTRIDLFAFVGQSMQLKMLRDELKAELSGSGDQALIAKSCIFLDDGTELKGAVAKGALYLLGPMTPHLEPVDYDRLVRLPYSIYARDFNNRILQEGMVIDTEIEGGLFKTKPEIFEARKIFQQVPASFDVKIRYEKVEIADPVTGHPRFLERTIGRLYFPMRLQDKAVAAGDRISFEYTSDEYLLSVLRLDGEECELTFEKFTVAFEESMLFYNR